MNVNIACIGSGNMGSALMKGAAKIAGGKNIGFADIDSAKAADAAAALGAKVYASNIEAVKNGDFIFLAVKPQILKTVLEEIAPAVQKRLVADQAPVLVSMAAGWTIAKIQTVITGDKPVSAKAAEHSGLVSLPPVVRVMPNTPALVSRGVIVMTPSRQVPAKKAAELEKILGAAGMVDRLDESYFDAVTGLSGSGPAFVYLFIEALADGGVKAGLPRDKALRYAAETVLGSAAMVLETGKHPGELKDMTASPGGTTIEGIKALENGCFRGAVMNAVEAAWRRSAELG
ncbi:MAG: pyrroline-5-carboxylate reductase [Treponema sp.]|jgi:pyrroline-5-carboxylate reductase|nr:pyrroline-5-carboxylate reductase [Treponema sp.]